MAVFVFVRDISKETEARRSMTLIIPLMLSILTPGLESSLSLK